MYKFILIVSTIFIIIIFMVSNCYTHNDLPSSENENEIAYAELKKYEMDLKEEIKQLKEERNYKEAYLASLNEELVRLEEQYNELLEERKRISEKLDSINTSKDY